MPYIEFPDFYETQWCFAPKNLTYYYSIKRNEANENLETLLSRLSDYFVNYVTIFGQAILLIIRYREQSKIVFWFDANAQIK